MAKDSKGTGPQIVIANNLASGRVVFLEKGAGAGSVSWGGLIETAEVADDEARANELLAWAEADVRDRNEVMDAYLIDVEVTAEGLRPTKYREAIRCLGPTIRLDLGKQAEGAEA